MKYILSIIILIMFSCSVFAQKAKIDDEIAYINEMEYVKWVGEKWSNEISIRNLVSNEELIFATYNSFNDPSRINPANPQGKTQYIELVFITLKKRCEIPAEMPKGLLKVIYNNELIKDGKLDEKMVDNFILKYGTKFTDQKKSLNSPVNIIINN